MKGYFSNFIRSSTLLLMGLTTHLNADTPENSDFNRVRLVGYTQKKALNEAVFLKSLDSNTQVPLTFILPLRNQNELEELVARLYDSSSEDYGRYLTSEEFIERFAPSEKDYNTVIAYARNLGLDVTGLHPNRTLLNVAGDAKTVEKGFDLHLNQYKSATGHKFYAPNDNPEVPKYIASIIGGVVGMDNSSVWHTYNQKKEIVNINQKGIGANAFPSGPGGGFSPNDLSRAYELTNVPTDGSGQSIALFELATYQTSDINTYASYFGLPTPKLINVLVDGGSNAGINPEVTLDIELALALSPKSQIYVYQGPNSDQGVLDTYNKIATDNLAKQISTSWGLGENFSSTQFLQAENAIFLQMAAHGQTIYAAAGDSGAYDDYPYNLSKALVVDDPASQPYVSGVGGTKLSVNSQTGDYLSESVWNEGLGKGAGGGGVSTVWTIPTWQSSIPNVRSTTYRNVPDVALNADPSTGYAIYHAGEWVIYGGTSCAAPLWASFTARVNQGRLASQMAVLGFANPTLYSIGTSSAYSGDFHDITQGNNLYYTANTGYDNASGLGSFNGVNLFTSLTNQVPPPPPPVGTPLLNVSMTHSATFVKGSVGTYVIQVANNGTGPTTDTVKVSISLPQGLSYNLFSGSGWIYNTNALTCIQSTPLNSGASYSTIVLKVDVDANAPSTVTPSVTVSGGGSVSKTVTDKTTVK